MRSASPACSVPLLKKARFLKEFGLSERRPFLSVVSAGAPREDTCPLRPRTGTHTPGDRNTGILYWQVLGAVPTSCSPSDEGNEGAVKRCQNQEWPSESFSNRRCRMDFAQKSDTCTAGECSSHLSSAHRISSCLISSQLNSFHLSSSQLISSHLVSSHPISSQLI